jgi:hypothetical protein
MGAQDAVGRPSAQSLRVPDTGSRSGPNPVAPSTVLVLPKNAPMLLLGRPTQSNCFKARSARQRRSLRHLKRRTQRRKTRRELQKSHRRLPLRSRQRECSPLSTSHASPFPPEAGGANVLRQQFLRLRLIRHSQDGSRQVRVAPLGVLGNHKIALGTG